MNLVVALILDAFVKEMNHPVDPNGEDENVLSEEEEKQQRGDDKKKDKETPKDNKGEKELLDDKPPIDDTLA